MTDRSGKKAREAIGVDEELGRALASASTGFGNAIAERLGIGATDQKCLELIQRARVDGPVTPGMIGERLGLTSGAVTAMLDRLEKAGFIRRAKDDEDRRQVVIQMVAEREAEIAGLFEPLHHGWAALVNSYEARELEVVRDFLQRATRVLHEAANELRGAVEVQAEAGTLSARRAGASHGRLEVIRGLSQVTLTAGPRELLYRLHSEGPAPKVAVRDGRVTVEPVRSLTQMFARRSVRIELCAAIPWELSVRGGIAHVDADLRALTITAIEISGGVHDVVLRLPRPSGAMKLRISGGASKIKVLRPAGAAARVAVGGGASGLVIDTLRLGSVGHEMKWETPDFAKAQDHVDVALRGGASNIEFTSEG